MILLKWLVIVYLPYIGQVIYVLYIVRGMFNELYVCVMKQLYSLVSANNVDL